MGQPEMKNKQYETFARACCSLYGDMPSNVFVQLLLIIDGSKYIQAPSTVSSSDILALVTILALFIKTKWAFSYELLFCSLNGVSLVG